MIPPPSTGQQIPGGTGGRRLPSVSVLGVPVSSLTRDSLLDVAFERIREGRKTLFSTANAHSIVQARRAARFAAHFREADAVLPDGVAAVVGAHLSGGRVRGRISGPDFFEAFLARAAGSGVSVFFLGTDDPTLRKLVGACRSRWPTLDVRGTLAPPFGELSLEERRFMVDGVNGARPDAVFVAMTAPRQELWLSRHLPELDVRFAMGVGAAFDFVAGTKARAPALFRRLGLEWLYRLAREPRRLWRRNLDSAVFLAALSVDALTRLGRPSLAAEPRSVTRHPARAALSLSGVAAHTVDVSELGLCAEIAAELSRGSAVSGAVHLDGRDVSFDGQVVWTRRASGLTRRVGVRFAAAVPDLMRSAQGGPGLPAAGLAS